jgi:hypothetical protein
MRPSDDNPGFTRAYWRTTRRAVTAVARRKRAVAKPRRPGPGISGLGPFRVSDATRRRDSFIGVALLLRCHNQIRAALRPATSMGHHAKAGRRPLSPF